MARLKGNLSKCEGSYSKITFEIATDSRSEIKTQLSYMITLMWAKHEYCEL